MRKQGELTDRKDKVKQTRKQSEMMEKMGKKKKKQIQDCKDTQ